MDKYDSIIFTKEIVDRFWSKVDLVYNVDKTTDFNSCMTWNAGQFNDGYGAFSIKRITYRAHRVSYVYYYGPVKRPNMVVCHICDNPLCVNPFHLFIGTVQDNCDDCKLKKRTLKGSTNPYSILNEHDVLEIKKLLQSKKYTQYEIAEMYGVARPTITDINRGHTWPHVIII